MASKLGALWACKYLIDKTYESLIEIRDHVPKQCPHRKPKNPFGHIERDMVAYNLHCKNCNRELYKYYDKPQ